MHQSCLHIHHPSYLPWLGVHDTSVTVHTDAAHRAPHNGQENPQVQVLDAKLEKLPRPTSSLDMTQSDYAFKESQWEAYIGQGVTSEQVKVQQLRAACDEELLRRVYDAGGLEKLSEIVDYVAAEEASLSSFSTLQSPHTIAAQSS